MPGKQSAKTLLERAPAFHRRLTGNQKDNVVGHETENGIDVTCSGGAVPKRYETTNCLFIRSHRNSLDDAQRGHQARLEAGPAADAESLGSLPVLGLAPTLEDD